MLSVMLVDDDINMVKCLRTLIDWEALDYKVIAEAFNGLEALNYANALNPDVIITDIRMPIMDGAELCRRVRENRDDVSIIFLSAHEDFSIAQFAFHYNVNEYIVKPITSKKVKSLVRILEDLSINYKSRDYYDRLTLNDNLAGEIILKLKENDEEYFTRFFDEFANYAAGDFTAVKESAIKLINILYDYLTSLGFDKDISAQRRIKTVGELKNLKKKKDIVMFAGNMYFDIINIGKNKENDYYHLTMQKIKEYIYSNFGDSNLGVATVADKFNFSADYLSKVFSRFAGVSMNAYISNLRIDESIALLKNPDIPIHQISALVGYSNANYFAKAFKKQTNLTPSEYRNRVFLWQREAGKDAKGL